MRILIYMIVLAFSGIGAAATIDYFDLYDVPIIDVVEDKLGKNDGIDVGPISGSVIVNHPTDETENATSDENARRSDAIVYYGSGWKWDYEQSPDDAEFEPVRELVLGYRCPIGMHCAPDPILHVGLISDPLSQREGRQIGVVTRSYFYCHEPTGEIYHVPPGFETDFLSIPQKFGLQEAIDPKEYMEAAVIHDWLYAIGEAGKKAHADRVFRDLLRELHARWDDTELMHLFVSRHDGESYGSEEEWRFIDIDTLRRANPPPYAKPSKAAVAISSDSCGDFFRLRFDLVRQFEEQGYGPLQ